MASLRDAEAAYEVVRDTQVVLRWCASPDAQLEIDDGTLEPVLPEHLLELFRAALRQIEAADFELAILTLRGANPDFPTEQVYRALDLAAWTGPALDFKLAVLDAGGREEVTQAAQAGGGRIRRRVFRRFVRLLNVSLDSLDGVPGVGAIKELKDFVEGAGGE